LRDHLANDGLICVFPEGRLTRNGLIGEFKHGYEKMLPENVDVPIIPVNISFTWGSIFSNFFTRPGVRKKLRFPCFSAVTFGKVLHKDTPVFEVRQKIIELGAEAAAKELPGEVTLHHAAVKLARKKPWKKRFFDGCERDISTFELVRNAAILSRKIRRRISSQDKRVGILLPNSCDAVEAILAVMMADRAAVPLNYSVPQSVLEYSISSAELPLVITSREFLKKIHITPGEKAVFIEDLHQEFSFTGKILMSMGMLFLPTGEFMNMLSPLSAFDTAQDAVLLFSSGSTGNPKGVRLSHHNLNTNARSVASGFAVDNNDMVVGNLPLFHSFGLNVCFWMPLVSGAKVVYIASPLDSSAVCRSTLCAGNAGTALP
jgi:acyl-[acyl-carrier-protein]-phospholipid O-acyltransferase/long-chain-fatty-acid--[acyl-carrier-protein] ligase